MAKKRKPSAKVATRRTPRRGKAAAAAEDGGATAETSDSPATTEPPTTDTTADPSVSEPSTAASEAPPSTEPSTSTSTSNAPATNPGVPVVVLHKKFGKYRCLFSNDDTSNRKIDAGSDSETNSSIEIRVVDPCASSESDSNAAVDAQAYNYGGASPSLLGESSSRTHSPAPVVTVPMTADIPLPSESAPIAGEIQLDLVPLPPPLDPEPVDMMEVMPQDAAPSIAIENIDLSSIPEPEPIIPQPEPINPQPEPINPQPEPDNTEAKDIAENTDNKKKDEEFQQHFEQLNIATSMESNVSSPMDCSEINNRTPPCGTPDLPFHKDHLELARPDPSLTPSSTLSDDSTSSRVTEQNQNNSNDSAESSPTGVRRSSRIKTISNLKQKTKGYGLVKTPLKKALITQTKLKLEEMGSDSQEKSMDTSLGAAPNSPSFPVPSELPVKVKSRWRRSSELEMGASSPASSPLASPNLPHKLQPINESSNHAEDSCPALSKEAYDKIIEERMAQFQHLDENEYMCERMISKDTKKMICDCFLTKEELERGEMACGEDCLNRLLMIECNSRCPVGDRCTNRRFQKKQNANLRVFYADKKGCGVEASVDIPAGEFLMEYVGEVLDYDQFYKRAQTYSDENNLHHYFMSLKGDTVIDATLKGNISRFINHSCDPNAETQKWTVNGELRIGFFSKRDIVAGEELTFDYQFQRFGKVAQRCYCGADACRGWIGAEPDSDDEDEEEEEGVSTSKTVTESSEETQATDDSTEKLDRPRKPKKERKYKPKAKDLVQDADIEEDLEALSRTGVKNQSHTLRLSRTIVRAKTRRCQVALLRLLRDADLPCRRLFLDYRGLRLLAPWCNDAPLDFRLEMLSTVDRLPVANKTLVQESRFISIVERWLSPTPIPHHQSFTDEATGLPIELPNRSAQDNAASVEKANAAILDKVKDLSNQLLERWSSLKEVFKIPKKERIQQMKEHERQANQMFPGGMMPPNMMVGGMGGMMPGMVPGMMPQEMPQEFQQLQQQQGFYQPFPGAQPICVPQANMMGMGGYVPQEPPKEIVLPSLWRSATDDKGRTYYYHVKLRQPQWVPPDPPPPQEDDSSSSEEEESMPELRMPTKGKFIEGVNGICEGTRTYNCLPW
ncbi:SET domain-containing protein [Phthorimaea operculella]|nr:SET domain-containing protein [Phthorimaea operculella]